MGNSFPFIDKINVPAVRPEHLFYPIASLHTTSYLICKFCINTNFIIFIASLSIH